ncbi:CBASS oligonucleotide cyclase [Pseudonocardia petroleophila]|nr:CBASS oligonucleotide cyclase [Pseudonocardia petroleophila]
MMLTVSEAFDKFSSRLEITETEEKAASRRQQDIRALLGDTFAIDDDFLTGSYRRETKTKPLRDVDIMIVLADRDYLDRHPRNVLADVEAALAPNYGQNRVEPDRRAVRVDFDVVGDVTGLDVVSFDVVPAFADDVNYLIPDDVLGEWISTNPKVHAEKATAANQAFAKQWKPLVKMIKSWNGQHGNPIDPSFLIEVMALDIMTGPWGSDRPRELRQFFATAHDRIDERWRDPAGLGPDISDTLHDTPGALEAARTALRAAEQTCTRAIQLQSSGRIGEALDTWQGLFGSAFAKS